MHEVVPMKKVGACPLLLSMPTYSISPLPAACSCRTFQRISQLASVPPSAGLPAMDLRLRTRSRATTYGLCRGWPIDAPVRSRLDAPFLSADVRLPLAE
jgi:hypothetical protein